MARCHLVLVIALASLFVKWLPPALADGRIPRGLEKRRLSMQIARLIEVINESPTERFGFDTPAVRQLTLIGEPALEPCLDALMKSDDNSTRARCQAVVGGIAEAIVQHELGVVFDSQITAENVDSYQEKEVKVQDAFSRLWEELGSLDYAAPVKERATSVQKWKKWLNQRRDRSF